MGSYKLIFKPSVERDLRTLPGSLVKRILRRIEGLVSDPFSRAVKLSGAERLYRVRVGNYRIVYEIDREAQQIIIHYVRHRRDVYRGL